MPRRVTWSLVTLAALAAGAAVLRLVVGPAGPGWPTDPAVLELRGLHAVVAAGTGAALGVSGLLLQALLRNPLASPDVLGVSSGASLAVVVSAYVATGAGAGEAVGVAPGGAGFGGLAWQGGSALVGAMLTLACVYGLGRRGGAGLRGGVVDPTTLVLMGVIVGVLASAGILLVQHLMPDRGFGTARLIVGTISDETPWSRAVALLVLAAAGAACAAWAGRVLDASSLSDDEAQSVGVRLGLTRAGLFAGAGALAAGAVVVAGPIGFVGLLAPHAAQRLCGWGGGYGALAPASALAGAALLTLADVGVAAIAPGGGRLPLGVVTALVGGPAFIVLLRRGVGGSQRA